MISRRTLLKGILAVGATGVSLGGYALAEPFRLRVSRYTVAPRHWPHGLALRFAVVADLHIVEPWMGLDRVRQIVARTNALNADAVLLLGDYVPSYSMKRWAGLVPGGRLVASDQWARELACFSAPLGTHAVLGNHDWWDDIAVQRARAGPVPAGEALKRAGVKVYENEAVRLTKDGGAFWIAGLGDQWAFWPQVGVRRRPIPYVGIHDLPATLAQVTDDAPVILMAHEPDIFAEMGPLGQRVALTVSGHTHGGQVTFAGFTPVVPSAYGSRFAHGHIVEDERHLVVSGGLGLSGVPLRLGSPPEIVIVDVVAEASRSHER
ncbi:MAG: metallophosphoesterase [Hyphomicrobiaceae bacterium]|nr:metallophosphoesterase [Hyphomicrobiaceae bacterium]